MTEEAGWLHDYYRLGLGTRERAGAVCGFAFMDGVEIQVGIAPDWLAG